MGEGQGPFPPFPRSAEWGRPSHCADSLNLVKRPTANTRKRKLPAFAVDAVHIGPWCRKRSTVRPEARSGPIVMCVAGIASATPFTLYPSSFPSFGLLSVMPRRLSNETTGHNFRPGMPSRPRLPFSGRSLADHQSGRRIHSSRNPPRRPEPSSRRSTLPFTGEISQSQH